MKNYQQLLDMERPASDHHMERAHRAKQFAPFAALKGFEESVREKEELYMEKPVLSEETVQRLDAKLRGLESGARISVRYFQAFPLAPEGKGKCLTVTGQFSRLDEVTGMLLLKDRKVPLADLLEVRTFLPDR